MKLRMPLLPADYLDRTELLAELDAGPPPGATTLVCAPTGYGKTLLLTDWATQPAPVPTAWVTLDGGDDDPRRLWGSVLAALAAHTPLPASTSVASAFAWSTAEHTEVVAALVADLHSLPNPITNVAAALPADRWQIIVLDARAEVLISAAGLTALTKLIDRGTGP